LENLDLSPYLTVQRLAKAGEMALIMATMFCEFSVHQKLSEMVFVFLMRGPAAAMSDVIMGAVLQQP
jgi:hypothetical protein